MSRTTFTCLLQYIYDDSQYNYNELFIIIIIFTSFRPNLRNNLEIYPNGYEGAFEHLNFLKTKILLVIPNNFRFRDIGAKFNNVNVNNWKE